MKTNNYKQTINYLKTNNIKYIIEDNKLIMYPITSPQMDNLQYKYSEYKYDETTNIVTLTTDISELKNDTNKYEDG